MPDALDDLRAALSHAQIQDDRLLPVALLRTVERIDPSTIRGHLVRDGLANGWCRWRSRLAVGTWERAAGDEPGPPLEGEWAIDEDCSARLLPFEASSLDVCRVRLTRERTLGDGEALRDGEIAALREQASSMRQVNGSRAAIHVFWTMEQAVGGPAPARVIDRFVGYEGSP